MFISAAQEWESFPVEIAGITYEIGYKISGAELETMTADIGLATLTVGISTRSAGSITLQFPHGLYADLGFTPEVDPEIFVNTIPSTGQTSYKGYSYELTIDFEQEAEEIEILGVWIPGGPYPGGAQHDNILVNGTYPSVAALIAEDGILPSHTSGCTRLQLHLFTKSENATH
jgi:hypothetical protein